jgi:Domain of unknown function (DUF4173)
MSVEAVEFSKQSNWAGHVRSWDWRSILIVASAALAAVIFAGGFDFSDAGSALVLCYLLPFVVLIKDWLSVGRPKLAAGLLSCAFITMVAISMDPVWFNLLVAWIMLVMAGLALRADAALDLARLVRNALVQIPGAPVLMAITGISSAMRLSRASKRLPLPKTASLLVPAVATAIFLGLLTIANPVIEATLLQVLNFDVSWLDVFFRTVITPANIFIFVMASIMLWPVLKSLARQVGKGVPTGQAMPAWHVLYFAPSTVAVTLAMLNGLFAWQNILDAQYVWFLGELPADTTHANYVHRGAYALIVTALLAAAFIVLALRKDSATTASPVVRWLVYGWIVQNVALVASSAQRTLSYVDDYGWTEWRVSGLLWMSLVCFGLASVIWRVWKNKSSIWLVNVNLLASGLLLTAITLFDIQGFAAGRNVDRTIADPSFQLDFAHLHALGPDAIPALRRLRDVTALPVTTSPQADGENRLLQTRIALILRPLENHVLYQQSDWRRWVLRNVFLQ